MAVTLAAWLQSLQALLPPGRALTREPSAVLTRLLTVFAAMLLAAQVRLEALLVEWDPLKASTMLADWERLLGLPDDCMTGLALSTSDRQRIASQRLMEQGGQSIPYFVGLAAELGEPGVTITEYWPMSCNDTCNGALYSEADAFTWHVRFARPAVDVRSMHCNDTCNDALQLYKAALAECPIRERKPAHTAVIFSYQ